jgi:DoxX-like family
MKRTNSIFWIITILFSAFMLFSAIPEIRLTAEAKLFMNHLGYPDYFNPFIGVLKILGVIAILVPGYPRITEWAYAGFFFDLTGATYSQIATDGFLPQIGFMLIVYIFWLVSYIYFHKRLKGAAKVV